MTLSRRNFLRDGAHALSAASLLGMPAFASAAKPAAKASIAIQDVNGLALITGAGCNVVALGSPEGALLVDGGLAAHSAALLKAVAAATNTQRVHTLINTHWHPEQTGSNEAVGKTGGTIISHEVTRLALGHRNRSALYEGNYGPLPEKALPKVTTYNTGSLQFAGEQVDYRYLPAAHTNGDLFVHFPKHNVIAAGGPVTGGQWPVIDWLGGGFYHGFLRSYEILADVVKPDTVVIGTQGTLLKGSDIVRHKDIYWALFKQFFTLFNKGFGPDDVVEFNRGKEFIGVTPVVADRPLKGLIEEQGDPSLFLEYAYRSLQQATLPY
jgi:glyoxylase-like metal-dependent hydrolase (beta-lactamase superfamily II)